MPDIPHYLPEKRLERPKNGPLTVSRDRTPAPPVGPTPPIPGTHVPATPNDDTLEVRLDAPDDDVADPSVLLTFRLNDLPLHLLMLEVTEAGPYGWPEPLDEDYATYVAALYDAWGTTKPPALLDWQNRRWLVTTEPFER